MLAPGTKLGTNGLVRLHSGRSQGQRTSENMRRSNNAQRMGQSVMPCMDQILTQLNDATVFSKLDANAEFRQIPVSTVLTTVVTLFGLYHYNGLPFGMKSTPEVFQKQISQSLNGLDGVHVVCLVDDTLAYAPNQNVHDDCSHPTTTDGQCRITLKNDKRQFSKKSVKFLSRVLSGDGITSDSGKVAAIEKMADAMTRARSDDFFSTS